MKEMKDWVVTIVYRNDKMEEVVRKEYDFADYTNMLYTGLMNTLIDIENAFYEMQGNKSKDEWSPSVKERFKTIRHKILDRANAVKRLPETLTYKGTSPLDISAGEFISRQINDITSM